IPADLIRVSAREVLAPEVAALAPEYVVVLGNTALAGLREIELYASALAGVGKITETPPEDLSEEHRRLCVPYPGGHNRRHPDRLEAGVAAIGLLVAAAVRGAPAGPVSHAAPPAARHPAGEARTPCISPQPGPCAPPPVLPRESSVQVGDI